MIGSLLTGENGKGGRGFNSRKTYKGQPQVSHVLGGQQPFCPEQMEGFQHTGPQKNQRSPQLICEGFQSQLCPFRGASARLIAARDLLLVFSSPELAPAQILR